MKKLVYYVPVRLDEETLGLLDELMKQVGKSNKSAVIRECIRGYAEAG